MNLRERIRVETRRSEAGNDGWGDENLGRFLWWCVNTHLNIKVEGYYSTTVDKAIPDDEELTRLYFDWLIKEET